MIDVTGTTEYGYYPVVSRTLGAGRLAYEDGPLSGTVDKIEHLYDELGREVTCKIDGVAATKSFDSLSRVTAETNALGTFNYGCLGNSAMLTSGTNPNGQVTVYQYYPSVSGSGGGNNSRRYPDGSVYNVESGTGFVTRRDARIY